MSAKWYFRRFRPGDNLSDPDFAKALFSRDGGSGLARSLVREAVQNSLDARESRESPVVVRFTLMTGHQAVQASAAAAFLDGIWPHMHAANAGLEDVPSVRGPIPYLVVEDFGTRGLTGDPSAWDPFESEKNAFFLFFRALGRSGKEGEDRGRWGVGKFVFPLASRGHCLLGLTVPAGNSSPLLMGRMVLKTHRAGETSFHPDGHWGNRSEDGGLVMPETDPAVLKSVRQLFRIQRTTESGLSVVVPWVSEELDGESVCNAVVSEYFLPLLRSELDVLVDENGSLTRINADTVQALASGFDSAVMRARIALAIDAATWPENGLTMLPMTDDGLDWSDDRFPEAISASLTESLAAGRPIGVRVPLMLRPKNAPPVATHFDVFVRHQPGVGSSRPLIVREGITIPEDRTVSVQDHVALVVVDHAPLAGFVGDAETPAHTELQNDLVKHRYTYSRKVILLMRMAAATILRALSEAAREDDFGLLSEFFPVPRPEERRGGARRPIPAPSGKQPEVHPDIPRVPPRFRIARVERGFTVSGVAEAQLPASLRIRFAYDVRRGNPLKKFRPYDFSLLRGGLVSDVEAAVILEQSDNSLTVRPTASGFRVEVTGFDPNRNLVVRVDTPSPDDRV